MAEGTTGGGPDAIDVTALVAEHHAPLYRYAHRLCGGADGAEDLVQQAFLLAYAKRDQLREPARARQWLYSILRNCFLKDYRKRTPARAADLGIELETTVTDVPEPEPYDRERLESAIAELPEEFRLVVVMFYFEGCSYREMAAALDLPSGTVMSRLSRAKAHLRRRLTAEISAEDATVPPPLTPSGRRTQGWDA